MKMERHAAAKQRMLTVSRKGKRQKLAELKEETEIQYCSWRLRHLPTSVIDSSSSQKIGKERLINLI